MIPEGIVTACSNHLAIATSRLLAVSKLFQKKPLGAMCFVIAKLGFKFKPKVKNREAVPNVIIVKPSTDHENPMKACCCSAAIL